jgi:hypothetical protein
MVIELDTPGAHGTDIQFDKFFKIKSKLCSLISFTVQSAEVEKTEVKHDDRTHELNMFKGIVKEIIGDTECYMRGNKRAPIRLNDGEYDSLQIRVDKDRSIVFFNLIPAKESLRVAKHSPNVQMTFEVFKLADPRLYDQVRDFIGWK